MHRRLHAVKHQHRCARVLLCDGELIHRRSIRDVLPPAGVRPSLILCGSSFEHQLIGVVDSSPDEESSMSRIRPNLNVFDNGFLLIPAPVGTRYEKLSPNTLYLIPTPTVKYFLLPLSLSS